MITIAKGPSPSSSRVHLRQRCIPSTERPMENNNGKTNSCHMLSPKEMKYDSSTDTVCPGFFERVLRENLNDKRRTAYRYPKTWHVA